MTTAEGAMVTLLVNGTARQVPSGHFLDRLIEECGAAPTGVAVAVNEDVVPRGAWPTTRLGEGDRVEILNAVQGG